MNLLLKTLIILTLTLSTSSCAFNMVNKKKIKYSSINTELSKEVTDKLKNSEFYEVDAYYNGKKEFANPLSSKGKKSPNIYEEYLVPNILDGDNRILQILIKQDERPAASTSAKIAFKSNKTAFKLNDNIIPIYGEGNQKTCEETFRRSYPDANRWNDLKYSLNNSNFNSESYLEQKAADQYHEYFIINEISSLKQEDLKDKPKVKFFISDDKNLSFIDYVILTTKIYKLDNKNGRYYFNREIIRDRQNKFLAEKFDSDEKNKIVLILSDSHIDSIASRSIIIAKKDKKEWSCFTAQQGKYNDVRAIKRNKTGVNNLEILDKLAIITDLVTLPVQIPVAFYLLSKKENPDQEEIKKEKAFKKELTEEYLKYQGKNNAKQHN